MKLEKATVLIIGGSAGIGLEIAKAFARLDATVIITGRDDNRLQAIGTSLRNAVAIPFDVNNEEEVKRLTERVTREFPRLNILVNNAGLAHTYVIAAGSRAWEKAAEEMQTNYLAVLRTTELFLPLLEKQPEAAIVNVSSIGAIAPNIRRLTYSASKAAVHSYTQGLRLVLRDTRIKVFELMPPLVATDFSRAAGETTGIPPELVANELLDAMRNDRFEIHVGRTAQIYELTKKSTTAAVNAVNGIKED